MRSLSNFFVAIFAITLAVGAKAEDCPAIEGVEYTCIESTEFTGKRCFYTYIPDCAGQDSPLVFDVHGHRSCPLYSAYYTGWVEKSDENCFVLVMPEGITDTDIADDRCFSFPGGLEANGKTSYGCCCTKGFATVDTGDDSFFRQVAAITARDIPMKTANKVSIDTKKIYMAGHSNGCIASIAMATLHSDMVAAVGCHAGTVLTPFPDSYAPTPMFLVHGTADVEVPYNGDEFFFGLPAAFDLISKANGCTVQDESTMVDDGNAVAKYMSTSCENDASVTLYALEGVEHTPYQGDDEGVQVTVDTTQRAWDFIKEYSLETAPELVVNIIDDPTNLDPSPAPSSSDLSPGSSSGDESSSARAASGNLICLLWMACILYLASA